MINTGLTRKTIIIGLSTIAAALFLADVYLLNDLRPNSGCSKAYKVHIAKFNASKQAPSKKAQAKTITKENFLDDLLDASFSSENDKKKYNVKIGCLLSGIEKNIDFALPNAEKAKAIFEYLAANIFKEQNIDAYSIGDVLDCGRWNCLSGTCLAAMIFDKLNIDYEIWHRSGDHLFLKVNGIVIETTLKEGGFGYKHETGELLTDKKVLLSWLIAGVYTAKGFNELNRNNLETAIDYFDRAIVNEPEYSTPYTNKGIALKDRGRLKEAKICFEEALIREPDGIAENINYSACLAKLGNSDLALKHYAHAKELFEMQRFSEEDTAHYSKILVKCKQLIDRASKIKN